MTFFRRLTERLMRRRRVKQQDVAAAYAELEHARADLYHRPDAANRHRVQCARLRLDQLR